MIMNYVMKMALMIKDTECILSTELVHLQENSDNFKSKLALLDKVEELKNGFSVGKYEIKAIPVAAYKSQDKLILFNSETKNGKWYLSHSKEPDSAIAELVKKISA